MYQFIIPNKKLKIYFAFALIINFLNFLGFSFYTTAFSKNTTSFWLVLAGIALVLCSSFYFISQSRRLQFAGTLMLVFSIFWLSRGVTQAFLINLMLWLLYSVSRRKLVISIDTTAVTYPAFPPKKIPWEEINNLVLKDDILTIDLKNNKIYQYFIEYADNPVNEGDFNDFCRTRLMAPGS